MGEGEMGERRGLFMTGRALNLGNPKAIAFFLALLPSVVELDALGPLAVAELAAVIATIAIRLVNRGSSVAVAGAAVAVAARWRFPPVAH